MERRKHSLLAAAAAAGAAVVVVERLVQHQRLAELGGRYWEVEEETSGRGKSQWLSTSLRGCSMCHA